jgi:hypothetical protein
MMCGYAIYESADLPHWQKVVRPVTVIKENDANDINAFTNI